MHEVIGDLARSSLGLFLFERIDQLDSREEANTFVMMLKQRPALAQACKALIIESVAAS